MNRAPLYYDVVPLLLSSVVVLAISFLSMEVAAVVGLIRTFFHYYLLHFVPVLLSLPIAYICFDKLIKLAQQWLDIKITKFVVLTTLLFMIIFVWHEYTIIILPNKFYLDRFFRQTVAPQDVFYAAVVPHMIFYAGLPIIFTASMLRRMNVTSTASINSLKA